MTFRKSPQRGADNLLVDYQKRVLRCAHCNKFLSPEKILSAQFISIKEAKVNVKCYHCGKEVTSANRKEYVYWIAWIKEHGKH